MTTTVGCAIFQYRVDKILIQKRTMTKKRYPGFWEIPGVRPSGGAMEDNESAEDCIRREMREELGIGIQNLENLYTDLVYRDGKRDVVFIFKGQCEIDSIKPDPLEVDEYCEITASEFGKYEFYPAVKVQIKRCFNDD